MMLRQPVARFPLKSNINTPIARLKRGAIYLNQCDEWLDSRCEYVLDVWEILS